MKSILDKLFTWTADEAYQKILETYHKDHFAVVNYLYFSSIVGQKLFCKTANQEQKKFRQFLMDSNFLFPDGIALQFFYLIARIRWLVKGPRYRLKNLNGTDFFPYFFKRLQQKYPDKINLIFYGVYDGRNLLTKKDQYKDARISAIKKHFGINVDYYYESEYSDTTYEDFDFEDMKKHLKPDCINIFMMSRWTPKQEFWTAHNMENIKKYKLLLFNQWWTIDFLCWFEKRAPKIIRKMKLERLWRLIILPKKNIPKVINTLSVFKYIFSYLLLKKE